MKQPTTGSHTRATIRRWIANLLWIVAGMLLYPLCINIFGQTAALIGIPAFILAMGAIWYVTSRRDAARQQD